MLPILACKHSSLSVAMLRLSRLFLRELDSSILISRGELLKRNGLKDVRSNNCNSQPLLRNQENGMNLVEYQLQLLGGEVSPSATFAKSCRVLISSILSFSCGSWSEWFRWGSRDPSGFPCLET